MIFEQPEEKIADLRKVFYILLGIYAVYLLYDLLFGDWSRFLWSSFALLLVAIPFAFERYNGMYFPWEIKIVFVLGLLLHTIGEVHRFYYILPNYDKISHITSSAAIASLIILFFIFIELYYGVEIKRSKIVFFTVLMAIAFGLFWEAWEIFSDRYFGSEFFWNSWDGISDVIADFAAAAYVAFVASGYLKERSIEEIAHDFLIKDRKGQYKRKWAVLPVEKRIESQPERENVSCVKLQRESRIAPSWEERDPASKS